MYGIMYPIFFQIAFFPNIHLERCDECKIAQASIANQSNINSKVIENCKR